MPTSRNKTPLIKTVSAATKKSAATLQTNLKTSTPGNRQTNSPQTPLKSTPSLKAKRSAETTPKTNTKTKNATALLQPHDFSIKIKPLNLNKYNGSIVIGVYEGGQLSPIGQIVDKYLDNALSKLVNSGDVKDKKSAVTILRQPNNVSNLRIVLVSLGAPQKISAKVFSSAANAAAKAIQGLPKGPCQWTLHDYIEVTGQEASWAASESVLAFFNARYQFQQCKSNTEDSNLFGISELILHAHREQQKTVNQGAEMGNAIGQGMGLSRDLGNLPGNLCTPTFLAKTASNIAKQYSMGIQVLERKDMEKLGMGSLLSVAKGSVEPPKLIVLKYNGGSTRQAPIALVGKGITFDTGGISLKPGAEMDEMKFDMCGAASVLGTLLAVAQLQLKINVIGIIPACENMPSGTASKPGDIITSMSGQTIEVLNTDAEGRLILCDALTFAEQFKPNTVVDIATLTGACVIALGNVNSGLFTKDDELADELLYAGQSAIDPAWRMPLDDEYQDQLKSNFADIANIGGRMAGSITAACFLARFTTNYRWAHLDIAGTAWRSGSAKGASGRPVPLLVKFLINRCKN